MSIRNEPTGEPANGPPVVVVLGAGSGLGRAIGKAFAEYGAKVVLMARNYGRLERISAEIGAAGIAAVDATDEIALRSAFNTVRESLGHPSVLVHNPSIAIEEPATRTSRSDLMAGFKLAPGSLLVAAQEIAPAMRHAGRGTILVTGNAAGLTGSTWSAALAAQKAAVRNLAFSLAAELGPDGVHVTTITIAGILGSPGFEHDRIAAEYVRLATLDEAALHAAGLTWPTEVTWPSRTN
jgi:NADP-dependent 3-hydroxy acid dehydrogenase YdfG